MGLAKISAPICGAICAPLFLHLTCNNAVDIRGYHILEEEEY